MYIVYSLVPRPPLALITASPGDEATVHCIYVYTVGVCGRIGSSLFLRLPSHWELLEPTFRISTE